VSRGFSACRVLVKVRTNPPACGRQAQLLIAETVVHNIMRINQLILTFLVCSPLVAQDSRLFENTWYLHDLVIDGSSNIPPINNEIPFVPADFFPNGEVQTGMCAETGVGQLAYFGTNEFDVISIAFLTGGCNQNEPFNQQYSSLYIGFWSYLEGNGIINYEIIEGSQNRTLIITGPNGDHGIYRNELLSTSDFEKGLDFVILPNPVKDILEVQCSDSQPIVSIEIFDHLGRLVLKTENVSNSLDVSALESGIYLVKVTQNSKFSATKRLLKL
jgi:Secretion system C-terminal sorting domain